MQMITSILTAYLGDWCARHQVSQSLTASNQDVRLLVRARQQGQGVPEESNLTRGWRAAHVLPGLVELLEGKRSLRIANVRSATPFTFSE